MSNALITTHLSISWASIPKNLRHICLKNICVLLLCLVLVLSILPQPAAAKDYPVPLPRTGTYNSL